MITEPYALWAIQRRLLATVTRPVVIDVDCDIDYIHPPRLRNVHIYVPDRGLITVPARTLQAAAYQEDAEAADVYLPLYRAALALTLLIEEAGASGNSYHPALGIAGTTTLGIALSLRHHAE